VNNKKIIVVILGYGCHLTDNLKNYLDKAIKFIKKDKNSIHLVICSGGFTNQKTAPGVSEAMLMAKYLLDHYVRTPLAFDSLPISTNENVKNIKKFLTKNSPDQYQITIFCDSSHSLKVKLASLFILGFWPKTITHDLTQNFFLKVKQILINTPLNLLAIKISFFQKLELKRKEKTIHNS